MYQHKKPICSFPGCDTKGGTPKSPFCVAHYGKERQAKIIRERGCSKNGCYLIATHHLDKIAWRLCSKHYAEEIIEKKQSDDIWQRNEKERINNLPDSPEKDWLKNRTKFHILLETLYYRIKYKSHSLRQQLYGDWEKEPFILFLRNKLPERSEIIAWCRNLKDEEEKQMFRIIYKKASNGTL